MSLPPLFFGSRLLCRCFDRIDSLFRWNRIFMRSLGCIIVNLVNSGMSSSATTNNSCVITFNPYWVINLTLLCSALLTLYYYAASGVFFRGRAGGKRERFVRDFSFWPLAIVFFSTVVLCCWYSKLSTPVGFMWSDTHQIASRYNCMKKGFYDF